MGTVQLLSTRCAICQTEGNATELYPANLDVRAFNPAVFSARRLPDRVHYRLVRCNICGLVRSDPMVAPEVLARLYAQSHFDYAGEVANLRLTYGRYLAKLSAYGARKGALLEIGCGNGFFLEEALAQGYLGVSGVEPSGEAVARAVPQVRPFIICGMMRPRMFPAEAFDVICMFQVLDHIAEPGDLLETCWAILKPGGMMLCINHNIEAASARLLREHSPIVDVEHTYLYNPKTMARLFSTHRFQVVDMGSVSNRYTLYYLARLVPMPGALKRRLLSFLSNRSVGQTLVSVPLGNLYLMARKPER